MKLGTLTRFTCAILALFVLLSITPPVTAVTQEDIDSLKEQQTEIANKRKEIQNQIDTIKKDKENTIQRKTLIENQIGHLRNEIQVVTDMMAQLELQIILKEEELDEAKQEEAKYYDLFCERVRSMEESGDVSYISILFGSSDFPDLLERVNVVNDISTYDNQIMDQLETARIAIDEAKAQLEKSHTEHENAKASLEDSQATLKAQQAELASIVAEIQAKQDEYQAQVDALSEDFVDLTNEIEKAEQAYQAEHNQGTGVGTGDFIWPVSGYTRISSPYGWRNHPISGKRSFHGGVDIPAPGGTNLLASKAGTVVISKYNSSYGNYVVIAHYDGTKTLYAHMRSAAVSAGNTVDQGQVIGYVGTTGSSTGNHLHFEIWTGSSSSTRVNPMNYF